MTYFPDAVRLSMSLIYILFSCSSLPQIIARAASSTDGITLAVIVVVEIQLVSSTGRWIMSF